MLLLDHVLIRTPDLGGTAAFLTAATGLTSGARPAFPFDGRWLYSGDRPLLHLVRAGDETNRVYLGGGPSAGPVDHIAFAGADYDALIARLTRHALPFYQRRVPRTGERQVFVTGPGGLKLEFLFPERTVP